MIYLLIICALVQIGLLLICYLGLSRIKPITTSDKTALPISVIIAARNEAANLEKNLHQIFAQDYPDFEVIVVNDRSTDSTAQVLTKFQVDYPKLKVIQLNEMGKGVGKKNAITHGIEAASNEYLVFTDADCYPSDQLWLQRFAGHFSNGCELVLGAGYFKPKSDLVNQLYRLESARIAMLYFSGAKLGLPYMGVGRSLAYSKSVFKQTNGFESHATIASGDDDLFVQSLVGKVEFGLAPDAITISESPRTLEEWFHQKARHLTTGKRYPKSVLFFLGLFDISNAILTLTFLRCLFVESGLISLSALIFMMVRYGVFRMVLLKLDAFSPLETRHTHLFLGDFILSIMNPLFSVAGIWKNPVEWKKTT